MNRPNAATRGYDAHWQRRRRAYLRRNPLCRLCGQRATIPDHWPRSRRQLLAAGVTDPDADQYLRPLCEPCHNQQTARNQPGGWNQRPPRRRPPVRHPGLTGGGGHPPRPDRP